MADLNLEALRLKLAAIEHERWSHWQSYVHNVCVQNPDGSLVIPPSLVVQWERQIATPFEALSDREQAADVKEVDRYWPLILAALERAQRLESAAAALVRERVTMERGTHGINLRIDKLERILKGRDG